MKNNDRSAKEQWTFQSAKAGTISDLETLLSNSKILTDFLELNKKELFIRI